MQIHRMKEKFSKNTSIVCTMLTIAILLMFAYLFLILDTNYVYADNLSTEEIQISKASDLYKISLSENKSKNFILLNDIDLQADKSWYENVVDYENGWNPISAIDNTGVFDGNGYRIYNLEIKRPDMQYVGLFSVCSLKIINLNVETVNLNESEAIIGGELAGVICAKLNGSIENVFVKGTVRAIDTAGGLTGQAYGTILYSNFEGYVSSRCVGGLIGNSVSAKISNSYAYANLKGKIVGGLIGIADYGTKSGDISNAVAFSKFLNSEEEGLTRIGGFIGIRSEGVNVINGYALDDYPSVAQGSDEGIDSLSKFAFIVKDNFHLDFDKIWYLSDTSLFPEIRHLIVDVKTNSKYIDRNQLVSKFRYYNGEIITISFPKNVIAKSVLLNEKENIDNVFDNKLELSVEENILIDVEFEFLVEVTTIKTGNGTVSTDKKYYQGGETVNINVLPDDGYLLDSVRVRFNNNEIVSLENNEETYHYEIEKDIEEDDDYLVVYVDFVEKDTGLQWWAIMLIVLASILGALIVVTIIILIGRKYRSRMDEEHE